VNTLDYVILIGSMLGIAAYAHLEHARTAQSQRYLKGAGDPLAHDRPFGDGDAGQRHHVSLHARPGLRGGLGFVQNYFGVPWR
jgi:hypothetical protein